MSVKWNASFVGQTYWCSRCEKMLDMEAFHRGNWRLSYCVSCTRIYNLAYSKSETGKVVIQARRERTREHSRAYQKAYDQRKPEVRQGINKRFRENHPEVVAAAKKKWNQTHVENTREYARRDLEKHREVRYAKTRARARSPEGKQYRREYVSRNREMIRSIIRVSGAKRRDGILVTQDGTVTKEFLVELYARTECYFCGQYTPEDQRTQEHLTPIVRGGAHSASNLVMACRFCNTSKHSRTEDEYYAYLALKKRLGS